AAGEAIGIPRKRVASLKLRLSKGKCIGLPHIPRLFWRGLIEARRRGVPLRRRFCDHGNLIDQLGRPKNLGPVTAIAMQDMAIVLLDRDLPQRSELVIGQLRLGPAADRPWSGPI